MHQAFPGSDYYEASAPFVTISRQRACPQPRPGRPDQRATTNGSHVPHTPIDESGAQLYPDSLSMATTQTITTAFPDDALEYLGSRPPHPSGQSSTAPQPISTRFEPVHRLRDLNTGSSRTPSRLACRTRPVWQYQAVPALSGLLPTLPGDPRIRLPSASAGLLRQSNGEGLSPPLGHVAPHGAPGRR